jgi:hypothetical protein
METVCGKMGRIFTVDTHAEREPFRIIVKGIRPILGFPTFVFYNAVLPFPVAEKVWKRDWRFSLSGANPDIF